MGNIQLLDESTINKIAAGEVVNRPASVVKELIENSIDANSSTIKVEIKNGGKSLIKITDNGIGMDPEDAKMSFVRHATSKISNVQDLLFLDTMGFRGEAMPSIASVSRLIMQTKTKEQEKGVEIVIEGGKVSSEQEIHVSKGTSITVKDLFYNIPAREKYLKGDKTEFSHILKIIQSLSLVHTDISFQLFHDNKKIFATTGNDNIGEVISEVYSYKIFKNMKKIEHQDLGIKINGYISTPAESKANKDKQVFVINKRVANNSTFHAAVNQATKFIFAASQHPYLFLKIETDPSEIDVNVHPAKTEIKLYKKSFIFDSIYKSIKKAFEGTATLQRNFDADSLPTYNIPHNSNQSKQNNVEFKPDDLFKEHPGQASRIYEVVMNQDSPNHNKQHMAQPQPPTTMVTSVFQFKEMYLAFFYANKLRIIDQHAAHERILFEELKNTNKTKASQELLFPMNIFLDKQDFLVYENIKEILETTGYIIDSFGSDSIIIRSVPVELPENCNHQELIQEIIINNKQDSKQDKVTKTLTTIACKAAIKAGDVLENKEKIKLVEDWLNCKNNVSCPHGRPIEKAFEEKEIDKWFHRG